MMDDTFILDAWDRVLIIGLAILLVFIVFTCIVCIVSPVCPINRLFQTEKSDSLKRQPIMAYGSTEYGSDVEINPIKHSNDAALNKGCSSHLRAIQESEMSDGLSDAGCSERIDLKQPPKSRRSNSSQLSHSSSGDSISGFLHSKAMISYSLWFDSDQNVLHVRNLRIDGLMALDANEVMALYIKIRVCRNSKHFWSFWKNDGHTSDNVDLEMSTRIQRQGVNDVMFNEDLTINCERMTLPKLYLRLLVYDFDRYQRHVILCEAIRQLNSICWSEDMNAQCHQYLNIPSEDELGHINVGLMSLPTSEKMNLFLLSARGLKLTDGQQCVDGFVKIMLMCDGRIMRKIKSSRLVIGSSSVLNLSYAFDVPTNQLEKMHFVISMFQSDKNGERKTIGRSYVGMNFTDEAREQWSEMMRNPRKQYTSWHPLQL